MDYNLALQSVSRNTAEESLNRVQRNALRFISGAMRTTLTAACEIHTNVEPLNLRREAAVMETVERYKRLDPNHPNRKLVDNWKSTKRIQRESVLDIALKLEDKHHLPTNREPIKKSLEQHPPFHSMAKPTIKEDLITNTNKRDADIIQLMTAAQKTINTYSDELIHIYTDGSAFKSTKRAGYGASIHFPDQTCYELSDSCGLNSSNFEAEAVAIEASLHHVGNVFTIAPAKRTDVVIFSDAKSVLQSLH